MIDERTVFVVVGDEEGVDLDGLGGAEVKYSVDNVVDGLVRQARAVEFGRFYLTPAP